MKNLKYLFFYAIIFSLFTACEASYDAMFEDFNQNFSTDASVSSSAGKNTSIKDAGFSQEDMIPQTTYSIPDDCMLVLFGPDDAASYRWFVNDTQIGSDKRLSYQLKGIFVTGGAQNSLTLIVTDDSGNEYSDKATVILYTR